jgi:hypothetical protein
MAHSVGKAATANKMSPGTEKAGTNNPPCRAWVARTASPRRMAEKTFMTATAKTSA